MAVRVLARLPVRWRPMSVRDAVDSAVRERPDLVAGTRLRRPKAWGQLAGAGVLAFRRIAGRAPSDVERRAIWSGLWAAAHGADDLTSSTGREREGG
jgi:hypothetical protein